MMTLPALLTSAGRAQEPFDKVDILSLVLSGVPSRFLASPVARIGITSKPDKTFLAVLRQAGAESVLLKALRSAKRRKGQHPDPQFASKESEAISHLARVVELREQQRVPLIEQEYRAAARLRPEDPSLHNSLGRFFFHKGDLNAAIMEYRNAIRLWPDYAGAHYNLGTVLARRLVTGFEGRPVLPGLGLA
jgi:tetratricopeptide (TPR) repeat protein